MKFTKMQGIGNDYVYVNCLQETIENPSELAKKISDRHYGVGSDGLIMIKPILKWRCIMRTVLVEKCAETGFAAWRNMYMITA